MSQSQIWALKRSPSTPLPEDMQASGRHSFLIDDSGFTIYENLNAKREAIIDTLLQGFSQAIDLIFNGNSELAEIVWLSLKVSGTALLISVVIGIPVGVLLGMARFFGRQIAVALTYTGMGFPTCSYRACCVFATLAQWCFGAVGLPACS